MYGSTFNAEEFLKRLTEHTKANLRNTQFGVSELAREMGMSRSNLHLRVKKLTKKSVSQFINQIRLEKAMELLKEGSLTVSETAFECGFQSVTYFTKCFHDKYGYSPGKAGNHITPDKAPDLTSTDKQKKKKWFFLPVVVLLFIIILLFVAQISDLLPLQNTKKEPALKNIAVLPMQFEGSDSMKLIAGGFRESLLNSLMNIENLGIRSETSVEQYRENIKPLKEIARELNVDYIIEMKGFQKGNEPWLQINLADAVSDAYLLRESFPLDIYEENFLSLQSLIAGKIIKNTHTDISTREKEILEERLTENPAALNYYLQGLQHKALNYQMTTYKTWNEALNETFKAKEKLKKAILIDSSFTAAYVQLAHIYIEQIHFQPVIENDLKNAYLDSGLVLAEKAISLYEQIPKERNYTWPSTLKSNYFYFKGDLEKSRQFAVKADEYQNRPKGEGYYEGKTWTQYRYDNYYESIKSFINYSDLVNENKIIPLAMYETYYFNLINTGFPELAVHYLQKNLATTEDTVQYYALLSLGYFHTGNYNNSLKYAKKGIEMDSLFHFVYYIMNSDIIQKDYADTFNYAKFFEQYENGIYLPEFPHNEKIGFLFQKRNDQKRAAEYFSCSVEYQLNQINSRTLQAAKYTSHFYLASTYSAMGEKEKALKYLNEVNNRSTIPSWMITSMNDWPLFDNIRNEPEFQRLKNEFEKKYQKEHNRIARLLMEKGINLSALTSKQ
jgi:AraC-like DNA-binding protein/TolB-like protein